MSIAQFKGIKFALLWLSARGHLALIRGWLAVFVVSVTVLDAVAIGVSASMTAWRSAPAGAVRTSPRRQPRHGGADPPRQVRTQA